MKKRHWSAIKTILFTYLAVTKILYWINAILASYENAGRIIWERLVQQDILVITIIVITYFFDKEAKKLSGILAHIALFVGGYLIYSLILIAYVLVIELMIPTPANLWMIVSSSFMLNSTIIFLIIAGAIEAKERFKKKAAREYALDIQSSNIKLEMLKALLDDGVLTHEEFDKQKAKLS